MNPDQFPTPWQEMPAAMRDALEVDIPAGAQIRIIEDPVRHYPYLNWKIGWIEPPVVHVLTIAAYDGEVPEMDADAPDILGHRRISLEAIVANHLDLISGGGTITLAGGEVVHDAPVALIHIYLDAHPL